MRWICISGHSIQQSVSKLIKTFHYEVCYIYWTETQQSREHVFLRSVLYYRRIINVEWMHHAHTHTQTSPFTAFLQQYSWTEQLLYAKLASKSNIHQSITGLIHCDKWICFSIKYSHRRQSGVAWHESEHRKTISSSGGWVGGSVENKQRTFIHTLGKHLYTYVLIWTWVLLITK